MTTDLDEVPDMKVTQNRVNASEAPAPAALGPNSVFALGGLGMGGTGDASERRESEATDEERVVEALTAIEAPRSIGALSDAIGLDWKRVKEALRALVKQKKVLVTGKGRGTKYSLVRDGGLGWVPGKPTVAKAKSKPKAKHNTPLKQRVSSARAKARAVARAPAPVVPAAAPVAVPAELDICCGLFSNGDLQIESAGQSMRLDRAKARHLVDYLLKIDAALQPRA